MHQDYFSLMSLEKCKWVVVYLSYNTSKTNKKIRKHKHTHTSTSTSTSTSSATSNDATEEPNGKIYATITQLTVLFYKHFFGGCLSFSLFYISLIRIIFHFSARQKIKTDIKRWKISGVFGLAVIFCAAFFVCCRFLIAVYRRASLFHFKH